MTITLFELAAKNSNQRFSPHCWKSHLALAHKQLDYVTEPVRFIEKDKIAFSNQPLVPVLTDDDKVVNDSWQIALYLEEKYPDAPRLFNDEASKAHAESFNRWLDTALAQHIRPLILLDIYAALDEDNQAYFRANREERLGTTLEEFGSRADESLAALRKELDTVREVLNEQKYIGGDQPNYADICLLGMFLWIACVNDVQFLEKEDIVYSWYQNMLTQYRDVLPDRVL